MKRLVAVLLSTALFGVFAAQAQERTTTTTTTTTTKGTRKKTTTKKAGPTVSEQLSEMKQAIEAQQQQIRQLSDQVQTREQRIQQLEQRIDQSQSAAVQAQTKADTAVAQTTEQHETVVALKSDVTDLKTTATNNALNLQETQKTLKETLESPLAIHYKGITITPGGFAAAETVYRNRALGADVNTPFNSVNPPGAPQNQISEFFGSGRQSRVLMLAEGKLHDIKMSGYFEGDFFSAGVTSNNNQSNSYTFRQRQAWAQAAFTNGLTVTGGQMWSLVTETRKGTDNRSEALPMTIDLQYTVGFGWARQFGFRVSKNFGNRFWLAGSLENPQTTFAASGNAANFAFGSPGNGGGLYNGGGSPTGTALANYSFNAMPDVILKAAFEPGFGHYEVFGILSRFRDRVYPCVEPLANPGLCGPAPSAFAAYNSSKEAGGVGGNARWTVANKHVDFGLHAIYGNGVARYGTSSLPDATVNADGTLAPLRSYQGLATLEYHSPKLDVYLNGGEEYVKRHSQTDFANTKLPAVGYGAPTFNDAGCYAETVPSGGNGFSFGGLANCSAQTQSLIEGTFGFWIKPYNGPKGRMQFGPQYSYLVRNAWAGAGPTKGTFVSPHGVENMFFASFRYYLP
jgi:cell division protein FtsB